MDKTIGKIAMCVLTIMLGIGCAKIGNEIVQASETPIVTGNNMDGDTMTNPWEDLFQKETTTAGGNSNNKETTTVKPTGTETKKNNVSVGKAVVKKAVRPNKKSRKAKITLKKLSKVSGYQIKYSTTKKFKKKTVKTVKSKKINITLKRLNTRKKYYVKARAYKKVNGKTYYGKWSKTKVIITRK